MVCKMAPSSAFGAAGRAESNVHVILRHQAGEADAGFAVGSHVGWSGRRFMVTSALGVGQDDALDAADADAGHFDGVAHFEVLDVFEQGVQVVAALEEAEAAEGFQNDQGEQ